MRDGTFPWPVKLYGLLGLFGAIVHGLGNLSLTLGLRGALHPGRLRTWAVRYRGYFNGCAISS